MKITIENMRIIRHALDLAKNEILTQLSTCPVVEANRQEIECLEAELAEIVDLESKFADWYFNANLNGNLRIG